MDPVSMILAFALQNPKVAADAVNAYKAPVEIDVSQLNSSVADFSIQALKCYHKTARFRGVDVLGAPWQQQSKFGAEGSVVLRIHLSGLTGTGYQMIVAAMARGGSYRAFVIDENTLVPYNKNCALEQWTTAGASN